MHSVKQMLDTRRPWSPRQQRQPVDEVVLMVPPDSRTTGMDCAAQQLFGQCRNAAEASESELPAQTSQHTFTSGISKTTSRASSLSRSQLLPSGSASIVAASLPAPRERSSSAVVWSSRHRRQVSPASQLPPWVVQTTQEQVTGRHPSKVCVLPSTRNVSKEPKVPALSSDLRPLSGAGSPSLDAPLPVPPALSLQQQQLPQEQMVQQPARSVGATISLARAAVARDQTMDSVYQYCLQQLGGHHQSAHHRCGRTGSCPRMGCLPVG